MRSVVLSVGFGMFVTGMLFAYEYFPHLSRYRLLIGCVSGLVFGLGFILLGNRRPPDHPKNTGRSNK